MLPIRAFANFSPYCVGYNAVIWIKERYIICSLARGGLRAPTNKNARSCEGAGHKVKIDVRQRNTDHIGTIRTS